MNQMTTTTQCPLCGAPLPDDGNSCTRCDWVPWDQERRQRNAGTARNPRDRAAAILSIIPGGGHVFKGYLWTGLALAIATPLVVLLAIALNLFVGWAVLPVYWAAVTLDAFSRPDLKRVTGANATV